MYIGTFPDYSHVPDYPYRPSRQDFRSPLPEPTRDLIVIPINSAPAEWATTPPRGEIALGSPGAVYEGSLDATSMVEIAGWVFDAYGEALNTRERPVELAVPRDQAALISAAAADQRVTLVALAE